MERNGLIIVLSGFSGAGKGTIMKNLLKTYPDMYHLSISATTRDMRPGEQDGREYFFKTREEFEDWIDATPEEYDKALAVIAAYAKWSGK